MSAFIIRWPTRIDAAGGLPHALHAANWQKSTIWGSWLQFMPFKVNLAQSPGFLHMLHIQMTSFFQRMLSKQLYAMIAAPET